MDLKKTLVLIKALFFLIASTISYGAELAASPWLGDKEIQQMVEEYVTTELGQRYDFDIQANASTIDPRLKLKHCDNLLTFSFNQGIQQMPFGRSTIKVSCDDVQGWTIYVPVQINAWKNLPTLASTVKKGHVILESDLIPQKVNLATLAPNYLEHHAHIVGKAATHTLTAGSTLFTNSLIEPDLIKRGDRITLMVQSDAIQVSTSAMATENGKRGQSITVENLSSNQKVTAKVIDASTVSLTL